MSQEKNRYKAKIAGNTYTIIGYENKEHMDLVTELVNQQLTEIIQLSPQISEDQAAILVAINALSDQIKKQEKLLSLEKQISELQSKIMYVEEMEAKINKIEQVEKQAKQVLQKNGTDEKELNHIEAQQIINQQVKEKIKQNHQETDEEKG